MPTKKSKSVAATAAAAAADRITAIDPMSDDPNRRRVRVGRRTVGTLSATQVESLRLRVGLAWTNRLADRVARAAAVDAARREALRVLGRAAVASATLRDRLVRKGHDEDAAGAAVDALLADGWLDDRAFAESVAEAALRRGPLGTEALAARLVRRGIDEALAEDVARDAVGVSDDAAVEEAIRWSKASVRRAGRLTPVRAATRVARGLARRGVDASTIDVVLRRLGLPNVVNGLVNGQDDDDAQESP